MPASLQYWVAQLSAITGKSSEAVEKAAQCLVDNGLEEAEVAFTLLCRTLHAFCHHCHLVQDLMDTSPDHLNHRPCDETDMIVIRRACRKMKGVASSATGTPPPAPLPKVDLAATLQKVQLAELSSDLWPTAAAVSDLLVECSAYSVPCCWLVWRSFCYSILLQTS